MDGALFLACSDHGDYNFMKGSKYTFAFKIIFLEEDMGVNISARFGEYNSFDVFGDNITSFLGSGSTARFPESRYLEGDFNNTSKVATVETEEGEIFFNSRTYSLSFVYLKPGSTDTEVTYKVPLNEILLSDIEGKMYPQFNVVKIDSNEGQEQINCMLSRSIENLRPLADRNRSHQLSSANNIYLKKVRLFLQNLE